MFVIVVRKKKAQFAVEHLIVVGIGLVVILPVVYYFYSYSASQSYDISVSQVENIGSKIINNAESLYSLGPPSRMTLKIQFPTIIDNVYLVGNPGNKRELVFNLTNEEGEVVFSSDVPLNGPFYNETYTSCTDECYSAGIKRITLVAYDDNVSLIIK